MITFQPQAGIGSTNVQDAIVEVNANKVLRTGDTMTGFLTLNADPVAPFQAATKHYVDGLVNGLTWVSPIIHVNLMSDTIIDPSSIVAYPSDVYIVPPGAAGAWNGLDYHVVTYTT